MRAVSTTALADTEADAQGRGDQTAAPTYSGLGAESVPRGHREVRAAAARPEVSRRIQAMLDVRAPAAARSRPTAKRLFFTWRVTGTARSGGSTARRFPVQLTGGEDRTSVAGITPDGSTLVVSRDSRRGEPRPLPARSRRRPAQARSSTSRRCRRSLAVHQRRRASALLPRQRHEARLVRHLPLGHRDAASASWSSTRRASGRSPTTQGDELLLVKNLGSTQRVYRVRPTTQEAHAALRPGRARGVRRSRTARSRARCSCATHKLGDFRRLYTLEGGKLDADHPRGEARRRRASRSTTRASASTTRSTRAATRGSTCSTRRRCKPIALPKLPPADHTSLRGHLARTAGSSQSPSSGATAAADAGRLRLADEEARRVARARARPRSTSTQFAPPTLETTRRATARRSRCSCGARATCAGRPLPGHRVLPRRPRGAGAAGLLAARADVRRRRLRLRRAQRARQRRLRQGVAPRRRRPEAPRRHHRHRGRREVHHDGVGARTARRRRSASSAAATAATRR